MQLVDSRRREWSTNVPEIGWLLAAIVVPLAFNPWGSNAFELPKVALLRALILFMGLGALVRIGEGRTNLGFAPIRQSWLLLLVPVLALGLVFALATVFSVNPRTSLWGTYERQQGLLTLGAYLALFIITAAYLCTRDQVERLWLALVWGSLPVILYALAQAIGLDPLDWRTDAFSPLLSTIGRSNFVGSYLVLILPLTIARLLQSPHKWVYVLLGTGQLVCLALTQTRGAWIGMGAAGLTMGLTWAATIHNKRLTYLLLALVVAATVCVILLNVSGAPFGFLAQFPGLERLAELARTDSGSTAARLTIWQATLSLITARPWLGYGPETMPTVFAHIFPPQLVYYQGRGVAVDRAHNVWLDMASSAGLIGMLAFLAVLVALACLAWKGWQTASQRWEQLLWAALAGSVMGHLVDLEFGFDLTATATIFWLILALVVALGRGLGMSTSGVMIRPRWSALFYCLPPALAVVLLIGLVCVRPVLADVAYQESQGVTRPLAQRLAAGESAVQLWSLEPEYHLRLAGLYFESGFPYAAESELLAAEQLEPNHPRIWAVRGDLYARWGEVEVAHYSQAELAYRRAIELAPNIATYHAALGWVLAQEKRWEEGVSELQRAVALDATDGDAYRLLAQVYMVLGREADATWAWKEAARWSKR